MKIDLWLRSLEEKQIESVWAALIYGQVMGLLKPKPPAEPVFFALQPISLFKNSANELWANFGRRQRWPSRVINHESKTKCRKMQRSPKLQISNFPIPISMPTDIVDKRGIYLAAEEFSKVSLGGIFEIAKSERWNGPEKLQVFPTFFLRQTFLMEKKTREAKKSLPPSDGLRTLTTLTQNSSLL